MSDTAADRIRAFLDAWNTLPDHNPTLYVEYEGRFRVEDPRDPRLWFALPESDLRALLDEREQLAARVAELEARPIGIIATDIQMSDADRARFAEAMAAFSTHGRDAANAVWAVTCECGCLPGQPCVCTLNDCECIGDCPVCDNDEVCHSGDDAEGCPLCTALRKRAALDARTTDGGAE